MSMFALLLDPFSYRVAKQHFYFGLISFQIIVLRNVSSYLVQHPSLLASSFNARSSISDLSYHLVVNCTCNYNRFKVVQASRAPL